MGLTGGLVKSVFSKNRSVRSQHDTNVMKICIVDKKRWSTVRSYLCGDEFTSVLADADSASVRTSDATVTQPVVVEQDLICDEAAQRDEQIVEDNQSLSSNQEGAAAIVIQSAFRCFLARRENEGRKIEEGLGSPRSEESLGSSVEVETGGSVQTFSLKEEKRVPVQHQYQKARSHNAKLKEDWDDSTVSSNVSKSRIQSRLEATTRRERALAYAFSQQLRVCSKKKPTQSEVNMGWSWLERWMATRPLETLSVEDRMSRQNEPVSVSTGHFTFVAGNNRKNFEEESCGSNEVSVKMNHLTITAPDDRYHHNKPGKNRLKAAKTVSRRKTVPSYHISPQWIKETKTDFFKEAGKRRKHEQVHSSSTDSSVQATNT